MDQPVPKPKKNNFMSKIYYFEGDDLYKLHKAVQAVREKYLQPGQELLNYEVIEDSNVDQMINAISLVPFMGGNRVVYIKDPSFLKSEKKKNISQEDFLRKYPALKDHWDRLFEPQEEAPEFWQLKTEADAELLKDIPEMQNLSNGKFERLVDLLKQSPDNVVIIMALMGSFADKRKKSIKDLKQIATEWQEFEQQVIKSSGQHDPELIAWIKDQMTEKGYRFQEDALEIFSQTSGRNYGVLEQELDKLITFAGERKEITAADVRLLMSYDEMALFDISNAVNRRDKKTLLSLLHQVLKDDYGALMKNLGGLASQLRTLLQVRSLQLQGIINSDKIAELTGIHPYRVKIIAADSKRYQIEELEQLLVALHEVDYGIRSGQGDGKILLELAISKYF
jgi:DNA polymerase III subunit delta